MKRSEMIEVIEDYLDITEDVEFANLSNKDKSEYILGCCETWGMSAPLWTPEFTAYGEPNSIQERTWEDEDEKK